MNVNIITSCLLIFCSTHLQAQKKFATEKGEVSFTSNAELELIKASSNKLKGLVDLTTNQFAFSVQVNSFQGFNSELQREHFNEKYLESDQFPRMTFTGKIIERVDISLDGVYEVRAKGDLEIHGQAQTRIIKSRIIVDEGQIRIEASFKVPLADHNIAIPRIVNQKIATEIEVVIKADMVLQ